ncbi:MAG: 5-(carboxyamino)imidazole ribonucleotide synthase [Cyclobacteriaceae bacterium]|nr:5-(carboxyamino)imidazole ribonucleotide synthase [Cyclobacteriaceae bacterium]
MEQLVTSDFKLGIIAGGQLGKMLVLAASNWDVKTFVLDTDDHCPASTCCTAFVKGNQLDYDAVIRFGGLVDMITFEIENVNIDALQRLKAEGKKIFPDPDALAVIQDKGLQKEFYKINKIPSPPFTLFKNTDEIVTATQTGTLTYPFVQKLRKGGYDGKGVAIIHSENDLKILLDGASVIEKLVDIQTEISVIVARNRKGEINCFPVVEMEFNEANLVEKLICPSSLDEEILQQAKEIAIHLISAFDLCGLLAVEMFVDKDKAVWVNEVAPRPHNSGHHTIESIITSQYEQLLRAIFNFPLGSTKVKMPSVMINLLGEPNFEGPVKYEGLTDCMGIEGVKIHLYGKKITKPFRKMGHVTIIATSIEEAKKKAAIVKQKLKVKSW